MIKRLCFITLILTLSINLAVGDSVGAVVASDWKAGRIIDDSVFMDGGGMTVNQIQDFLNGKVGTGNNAVPGQCDTNGTRTSELGGGTRAQYGASNGNPAPFTCLKDFYEVPKTSPSPTIPLNNYGGIPIPAGAKSAARLIWDAAQQYSINPKVLLVKLGTESAGPLTSDDWPFLRQYTYAMGAHCPDSGPGGSANCDSNYAGFSIQISEAASLLRYYLDNMAQPWWSYKKPYQNNNILWNVVERGCGGSNVYIDTKATAALYTYTPYQPNQAALNNMYGTGDNCSAYGNRNFWRVFNDWFGPTLMNSNLLRTVDNASVYLVSGDNKYPISDINILGALYPLGGVGYVSQSYLDTKTTGSSLGRVIRSSGGTVYFYDAGIKLAFTSCAQVVTYGSSCGGAILLEDYQIQNLATGPNMTNLFGTTSGKTFYIDAGKKREAFDSVSLSQAGITAGKNILNESALNGLAYGTPVLRGDVVINDRSTGTKYLYTDSKAIPLDQGLLTSTALNNLALNKLDTSSINNLTKVANSNGFISGTDGSSYVLVSNGKIKLNNAPEWSTVYTQVSDALLAQLQTTATISLPYTVKSVNSGTIYLVVNAQKRPITSWSDLLLLSSSLNIISVPDYYLSKIPDGDNVLSPGLLVKTPDNATVYVIDGLSKKIPISSFNPAVELGFNSLKVISNDRLSRYTTVGTLNPMVKCDTREGIAVGGTVYELSLSYASYTTLSDETCRKLTWKPSPGFLLDSGGTIYHLNDSKKYPITSYTTFLNLGGGTAVTVPASNYSLKYIETGASL